MNWKARGSWCIVIGMMMLVCLAFWLLVGEPRIAALETQLRAHVAADSVWAAPIVVPARTVWSEDVPLPPPNTRHRVTLFYPNGKAHTWEPVSDLLIGLDKGADLVAFTYKGKRYSIMGTVVVECLTGCD